MPARLRLASPLARSSTSWRAPAQKAARGLLRDFAEVEQLQVSRQGPGDFVSQADIRAEKSLREELAKARPGFGFLMEEAAPRSGRLGMALGGRSARRHQQFPARHPALGDQRRHREAHGGRTELVAGVIYNPAANEMFWAEKGAGAFLNDRRLRVSARRDMREALFATGIPFAAAPRRQFTIPWRS